MLELPKTRFTIKVRREQAIRLRLLRAAYQEKLGIKVTMTNFIENILDSFLDDPTEVWTSRKKTS